MAGSLSALGIGRLKSYLESLGRYAGIPAVLIGALLGMIVLALGFGVTALAIWLSSLWGAAIAFAVVGAGFLVAALLLEVIVMVRKNRRTKIVPPYRADMASDQAAFGSVAAMAIIGYILGRRIMRR